MAATHLYRIAQEAINNALKHGTPHPTAGRARKARRARPPSLSMTMASVFHHRKERSHGMGLRTIAYRAGMIGADVSVQSEPGPRNHSSPAPSRPADEKETVQSGDAAQESRPDHRRSRHGARRRRRDHRAGRRPFGLLHRLHRERGTGIVQKAQTGSCPGRHHSAGEKRHRVHQRRARHPARSPDSRHVDARRIALRRSRPARRRARLHPETGRRRQIDRGDAPRPARRDRRQRKNHRALAGEILRAGHDGFAAGRT